MCKSRKRTGIATSKFLTSHNKSSSVEGITYHWHFQDTVIMTKKGKNNKGIGYDPPNMKMVQAHFLDLFKAVLTADQKPQVIEQGIIFKKYWIRT